MTTHLSIILFVPVLTGLVGAFLPGDGARWTVLIGTLIVRYAMAWQVGWGVLRDRQVWRDGWLLPVRDIVALSVFLVSFGGHSVVWRGERFVLKEGKLSRVK